jgi:hypothetical protein
MINGIPPGVPGSPEYIPPGPPPGTPGGPGYIPPGMPGSPEYMSFRRRMSGGSGPGGDGGLPSGCGVIAIVMFAVIFVAVLAWILFVWIHIAGAQ